MAVQIQGNGGVIAEVDGTDFRALRIARRPIDYGALGFYAISMQTGIMAAGFGGGAQIFQARWTDATRFAAIYDVSLDGVGSITAFAAGISKFQTVIQRAWTADGSGGTAATLTGNNQKLRTSMGTTLFGAIRIATTGNLTAGTAILDIQGIGAVVGSVEAVAGDPVIPISAAEMFNANNDSDNQPVILATQEGIGVQATVPVTGTWTAGISMRWAELTSY